MDSEANGSDSPNAYTCGLSAEPFKNCVVGPPLHLCPVCLRKLCWNLQVEAVPYLMRLEKFCRRHGFDGEAGWYAKACEALTT